MKVVTCDRVFLNGKRCGAEGAYYFVVLRDPHGGDTKESARSLKRDLCQSCATEVAALLGIEAKTAEGGSV